MKHLVALSLSILVLASCASSGVPKDMMNPYEDKDFSFFFPTDNQMRIFNTLDEAYLYVSTAQKSLRSACGKNLAKGLTAKLEGPRVENPLPVTVGYFIEAWDTRARLNTQNLSAALEGELKKAISVNVYFLIFYGDRGVAVSNYFLKEGYVYNSNNFYESFYHNNLSFSASYPAGWNLKKGISYLRGE